MVAPAAAPLKPGLRDRPLDARDVADARVPDLGPWLADPPTIVPFSWLGRALRKLRLKHWQFVSVTSPSLFMGIGAVSLHFVSAAFAYVYLKEEKRYEEFSAVAPLALGTTYGGRPDSGETSFSTPFMNVRFASDCVRHVREISVDARKSSLRLRASLVVSELPSWSSEALNLVSDLGGGRPSFTFKAVGAPASGGVFLGKEHFPVRAGEALACVDWTTAYSTRVTTWNWASAAGFDARGRIIGFNLARGINEAANGVTENAVWIEGRRMPIATCRFSFDHGNPMSSWTIRSDDGRISLRFLPVGLRREQVNLLVVNSNLLQTFGLFRGHAVDNDGVRHGFDNIFGVTEDHYSRW
ncbi:MAG: DUF2804 domain-containing protein [Candidatus Schekmanbacteria bacterium]|nr:DUF2804 domain-containing protein [Candidatus Schekmanbacteria bacterium]